jgi:hypothetical protein
MNRLRVTFAAAAAGAASTETLALSGLVFPFGASATPSTGGVVAFAADGDHIPATSRVWLNLEHRETDRIGYADADAFAADADGMRATFQLLPTAAARDAHIEATSGARDGLSVEVEVLASADVDGVTVVQASRIVGVALTMRPAFDDARIAAASAAETAETAEIAEIAETAEIAEIAETAEIAATNDGDKTMHLTNNLPSAGEYVVASLSGDAGRVAGVVERIHASDAAMTTFLADIPGVIPIPLLADMLRLYDSGSPVFNALGARSAPAATRFRVPSVTSRLDAATAAPEGVDVSADFTIGEIEVAMSALKRAVVLSAEAVLYSQIDIASEAVGQLLDSLITGRETLTLSHLSSLTGTAPKVTVAANGSDVWSHLADATTDTVRAIGRAPDLAVLDLATWAKLAGMTNSLGAPIVQGISQTLAGGVTGSLFGLPVVASPLASKSWLISRAAVTSWINGDVRVRAESAANMTYSLGGLMSVGVGVGSALAVRELAVA